MEIFYIREDVYIVSYFYEVINWWLWFLGGFENVM